MNLIAWIIIICEISFWLVILLGLFTRYIWKKPMLGLFILALTPIIDLMLLVFTGYDLAQGATATMAHGLAAVYIGVSIVFGKSMIQWADERFRYYVTKEGPKPVKLVGREYAFHYLKGWGKHVFSYVIGAGILAFVIFFINDATKTEAMSGMIRVWTLIVGIDLIIAISYFIWPRGVKA